MRTAFAALLLLLSCTLQAQPLEHEVKAAFLFKFPSFVEWPRALPDSGPMVIGVAGDDAVATQLEQIAAGRTIQGRAVAVRRLREGERPDGLHVLFLGQGQEPRLAEIMRQAPAQPLLLVSEWPGALQQGAVVNFVRDAGRVRFEVSLESAERRSLRVSSRMLAVAHYVVPGRL